MAVRSQACAAFRHVNGQSSLFAVPLPRGAFHGCFCRKKPPFFFNPGVLGITVTPPRPEPSYWPLGYSAWPLIDQPCKTLHLGVCRCCHRAKGAYVQLMRKQPPKWNPSWRPRCPTQDVRDCCHPANPTKLRKKVHANLGASPMNRVRRIATYRHHDVQH